MLRSGFMRALLTVSLVITIPASVAAQGGAPGPEGERWDLTAYGVDGLAPAPWNIDATLLLEGGAASGSTGCERFSGDYELMAEALTFADVLDVTRGTCVGGAAALEAGYLAALPQVATWTIVDEELQLSDATGSVILVFAQPVVGLTASDIAGLVAVLDNQGADLERLDQRLDAIRIGTLRDRIKALEAQVASLKTPAAASSKGTTAFTAAEKTLLTAIPSRIRRTCTPRRDQNPPGTAAAVQCKPTTAKVRDMAYYLMEGSEATDVLQERMNAYGAKPRGGATCARGKAGHVYFTGGYQSSGCYVNEDGRASLRYVISPWDNCMNLKAGGTRIEHPTLYIAVLGPDSDLAALAKWAEPKADARPSALFKRFQRRVDACGFTPPT